MVLCQNIHQRRNRRLGRNAQGPKYDVRRRRETGRALSARKRPRKIVHHWQAIYRHAFYRGGPVLTSVLSGIDQALWDIKGKALGLPVYELLSGPTREKIRVYGRRREAEAGLVNATKTRPRADGRKAYRYVESQGCVQQVARNFGDLREQLGPEVDIGIDFHGTVQPQTAMLLIRASNRINPFSLKSRFIVRMSMRWPNWLGRPTSRSPRASASLHQVGIPRNSGKESGQHFAVRHLLRRRYYGAAPDHRLGRGVLVPLAPHNPQGPCSLAASCQIAAAIPNFLIQQSGARSHANLLKVPFHQENYYLPLPKDPGLGIEIDKDKLMAEVGPPRPYPETYDIDDGSVVDW